MGYNLPEILYWNLNNSTSYPKSKKYKNIQTINGYSQYILDFIISNSQYNPKELLIRILTDYNYYNLKMILDR